MTKTEQELTQMEKELKEGFANLESNEKEFAELEEKRNEEFNKIQKEAQERFDKYVKEQEQRLNESGKTGLTSQPQPKSAFKDGSKEKRDREQKIAEQQAEEAKEIKKKKSES